MLSLYFIFTFLYLCVCVCCKCFSAGVKRFKGQRTEDRSSRWSKEIYAHCALVERVLFCVNHVAMTVFFLGGGDYSQFHAHNFKNVFRQ